MTNETSKSHMTNDVSIEIVVFSLIQFIH